MHTNVAFIINMRHYDIVNKSKNGNLISFLVCEYDIIL